MKIINQIISVLFSIKAKVLNYIIKININAGKNFVVHHPFVVVYPENIKIGDNVKINSNAYIEAYGGVEIGNDVRIARNLAVFSANHNYKLHNYLTDYMKLPIEKSLVKKPVKIGNNIWIGANVSIVPGVTIGDGAVIGLGTVVNKDVPENAIIGSQPYRILKYMVRGTSKPLYNKAGL